LLDERGFHRRKTIQEIGNGLDGFFCCWFHATSRICYINSWGECQARIFIELLLTFKVEGDRFALGGLRC
jgi:hypothetical protein